MAVCMVRRRFREDQAQENPALQRTLAKLERTIRSEDQTEYLESDPEGFRTKVRPCPQEVPQFVAGFCRSVGPE